MLARQPERGQDRRGGNLELRQQPVRRPDGGGGGHHHRFGQARIRAQVCRQKIGAIGGNEADAKAGLIGQWQDPIGAHAFIRQRLRHSLSGRIAAHRHQHVHLDAEAMQSQAQIQPLAAMFLKHPLCRQRFPRHRQPVHMQKMRIHVVAKHKSFHFFPSGIVWYLFGITRFAV